MNVRKVFEAFLIALTVCTVFTVFVGGLVVCLYAGWRT